MSNRLYDILNKFNNLVAKEEPKKTITESTKPKTKLEETMAKVEEKYMGFKAVEKAAKKGGAKDPAAVAASIGREKYGKEKFQKAAAAGKKMGEAAKPDFLDMDKDGNKKEPMKKAIKDKKVNESGRELVSGQPLGIQGKLTPFYYGAIAKYLKANGLNSVAQLGSEDIDALSSKLGVSMEALADLVGFNEVTEDATNKELADQIAQLLAKGNKVDSRVAGAMGHIVRAEGTHITLAKLNKPTSKIRYSWMLTPKRAEQLEIVKAGPNHFVVRDTDEAWGDTQKSLGLETPMEAAENPYQQRILDANKADLAEFLKTGYLDTTSDLYYQMYEYYADQMDPKTRRNQDAQYDFITGKIREIAGVNEAAAPGQESWIKKNKERFVKQYGKKKGMEVLYATAWKRSKKDEGAYDAEISDEDPVFEGDDYWDFKDLPKQSTSGTRKVAGTRYGGSAQKDDDDEDDEFGGNKKADAPKRGRGRPKGSGKKMGTKGPTGTSKLASKAAIKESRPSLMDRLLDETYASFGEDADDLTLDQDQLRQHIGNATFEQLRRALQVTGTFPDEMLPVLQDYFSSTGEMPYGAATAEDEDPYEWIGKKLEQMFGDEVGYDQENVDIDMGEPGEDEMNAESVNESNNMIAESLSRILHTYPHEVKTFLAGGDLDNDLYSALVDYYDNQGEMPYRVKTGSGTIDWVADKFGTDLRNVELDEAGPNLSDVPAYMRKQQGQNFPLTRDQITPAEEFLWVVPGPGSRDFEARAFPNTPQGKMAADEFAYGVKGNVVLSAEQPVAEETAGGLESELKELARLAGLKESCGDVSPLTQTDAQAPAAGMSINTNVDTRTGTKTMTVTADGEVADKLAEILSLSGLATQVTARSSEVVGQDAEQEPEMQVVAVGETKDDRYHANTTPEPEEAEVDAIIDQGDDLNRKKKQHADKPKLGDNPMATESMSISGRLMRELESIKIKK